MSCMQKPGGIIALLDEAWYVISYSKNCEHIKMTKQINIFAYNMPAKEFLNTGEHGGRTCFDNFISLLNRKQKLYNS